MLVFSFKFILWLSSLKFPHWHWFPEGLLLQRLYEFLFSGGQSLYTCNVCVWISHSVVSGSLWPMDCGPPGYSFMGFSRQEYCSGLPFPSPNTCNMHSLVFSYWRIITLQYCAGFYHTSTWMQNGAKWESGVETYITIYWFFSRI